MAVRLCLGSDAHVGTRKLEAGANMLSSSAEFLSIMGQLDPHKQHDLEKQAYISKHAKIKELAASQFSGLDTQATVTQLSAVISQCSSLSLLDFTGEA